VIAMIFQNTGDLHGDRTLGEHKVRPYGTAPDLVGYIVQAFKSITGHECTIGDGQHGWPPFSGNYGNGIIANIPYVLPMSGTLSPHAEIKMHPFCHTD
jgi:hypothetical protein